MKNIVAICVCSIGVLALGYAAGSPGLEGAWKGREAASSDPGSASLVFEKAKLEFHNADTNEWYKGTYTLSEDKTPKQMVVVITECPMPQYVGKTAYAIYEIKNGELTLAGNEPGNTAVPANFDAPGARKFVFKRK